jgi:hypothetical protein
MEEGCLGYISLSVRRKLFVCVSVCFVEGVLFIKQPTRILQAKDIIYCRSFLSVIYVYNGYIFCYEFPFWRN